MSALITSGKSHTRCFVSVGGIKASLAWRRFEYTQTCSLLIATLSIVATNLYFLYKLHCRFTNPDVCICTYPTDITCNKTISQHLCESSRGEKGFWRSLVSRVGSCSKSINTTVSFSLTRQMFTHNIVNKHASVSSLSASFSTNC